MIKQKQSILARSSTPSLLRSERGEGSVGYLLTVSVIGLAGLVGMSALGVSMGKSIHGGAHGNAMRSSSTMVTSSQAALLGDELRIAEELTRSVRTAFPDGAAKLTKWSDPNAFAATHGNIVIQGGPGTGKTTLALFAQSEAAGLWKAAGQEVQGFLVDRLNFKESLADIEAARTASNRGPIHVILEDVDQWGEDATKAVRILLDKSRDDATVQFVATSRSTKIADSLREAGLLDTKIRINKLDEAQRKALIEHFVSGLDQKVQDELPTQFAEEFAALTDDFTPAALKRLVDLSAEGGPKEAFEWVREIVRGDEAKPRVKFEELEGFADIKNEILETLAGIEIKRDAGLNHTAGLVLAGPPGSGKSILAEAMHTLFEHYMQMNVGRIRSKWVGEAGEKVNSIYDAAFGNEGTTLVHIEEGDALLGQRSSEASAGDAAMEHNATVGIILDRLDGAGLGSEKSKVFTVITTNLVDQIDEAVLRSARLKVINVPAPGPEERVGIWNYFLKKVGHKAKADRVRELAARTEGKTGADIEQIVGDALVANKRHGVSFDAELEKRLNPASTTSGPRRR